MKPSKPKTDGRPTFTTLETVVVATEDGVPLKYPGGRDALDADTTRHYPDGNVATTLRRVPGVYYIPENANDSRINVGIRGNDPRRSGLVALLVDGIPVGEAPYGNTDIDGLPITTERIWKIDVIRGGGSIRYGPNSAGGVINFLTEPVPNHGLLRLGSRIGSNNDFSESIITGGTWGDVGVLVSGVWKGGDGFRENSTFEDFDGSIKFRYALSESEWIQAYVSRFDEPDAENPGGLSQADYDIDPSQANRPGAGFDFDTNRYVVQYDKEISDDSYFELKAWHQEGFRRLTDVRPILPPFTDARFQESDFDSGALESAYSWSADWLGFRHSFRHSFRYLTESNDEFYYRQPLAGGPPTVPFELFADFKGRSFSSFNEDVISLTDNLELGVGFRVEDITMDGVSKDDGNQIVKHYTELLPESTLTWKFMHDTAAYASFQESFYAPQYETGFDPASVLFAPTTPERSEAYEVGLRSEEIEGMHASVALFDNEFHDKLDFINTPDGKVPVNSGHTRARGIEVGVDYDLSVVNRALDGLFVYGTVTSMESTIKTGANKGNDTPSAPHLLASWGAEYDHASTGLWGRLGGSYSDESFKDPANTEAGSADGLVGLQPAFTLWDAAVGWHQNPDRSGFSISFGVTNLLDEDYFRRFSTGIFPGAPREAFAAITYEVSL